MPLQPPLDEHDHVAGPFDAPLELVMYGDFQCPYCAASQSIVRRVRDRLEGRLRFVFRHLPLTEVHPDARSSPSVTGREVSDMEANLSKDLRIARRRSRRVARPGVLCRRDRAHRDAIGSPPRAHVGRGR